MKHAIKETRYGEDVATDAVYYAATIVSARNTIMASRGSNTYCDITARISMIYLPYNISCDH